MNVLCVTQAFCVKVHLHSARNEALVCKMNCFWEKSTLPCAKCSFCVRNELSLVRKQLRFMQNERFGVISTLPYAKLALFVRNQFCCIRNEVLVSEKNFFVRIELCCVRNELFERDSTLLWAICTFGRETNLLYAKLTYCVQNERFGWEINFAVCEMNLMCAQRTCYVSCCELKELFLWESKFSVHEMNFMCEISPLLCAKWLLCVTNQLCQVQN